MVTINQALTATLTAAEDWADRSGFPAVAALDLTGREQQDSEMRALVMDCVGKPTDPTSLISELTSTLSSMSHSAARQVVILLQQVVESLATKVNNDYQAKVAQALIPAIQSDSFEINNDPLKNPPQISSLKHWMQTFQGIQPSTDSPSLYIYVNLKASNATIPLLIEFNIDRQTLMRNKGVVPSSDAINLNTLFVIGEQKYTFRHDIQNNSQSDLGRALQARLAEIKQLIVDTLTTP